MKAEVKQIATKSEQVKELAPLPRGVLEFAEQNHCTHYCGKVPAGLNPRDIEQSRAFWSLLGQDLNEFDDVRLVPIDREWLADFVVVGTSPVEVRLLQATVIGATETGAGAPKPIPKGYNIRRADPGGRAGWIVVRAATASDDEVAMHDIESPFSDFQKAYDFLLAHAVFRTQQPTKFLP